MRAVRLLEYALTKEPMTVLDVGVGRGMHAFSFLANKCLVTGLDVREPTLTHSDYRHISSTIEQAELDETFDMVWCCHTLEHLPNVQMSLIKMRKWLNDDGFMVVAVPTDRQQRLHVGHLTLWTPAHLVYNLICAGFDCKEALWYTEYCTIGLIVQKKPDIDYSGRTGMPSETAWLNQYSPIPIRHNDGAWWGNRWPEEDGFTPRPPDPPATTAGSEITNLAPEVQLAFGPNPSLRKPHGRSKSN